MSNIDQNGDADTGADQSGTLVVDSAPLESLLDLLKDAQKLVVIHSADVKNLKGQLHEANNKIGSMEESHKKQVEQLEVKLDTAAGTIQTATKAHKAELAAAEARARIQSQQIKSLTAEVEKLRVRASGSSGVAMDAHSEAHYSEMKKMFTDEMERLTADFRDNKMPLDFNDAQRMTMVQKFSLYLPGSAEKRAKTYLENWLVCFCILSPFSFSYIISTLSNMITFDLNWLTVLFSGSLNVPRTALHALILLPY